LLPCSPSGMIFSHPRWNTPTIIQNYLSRVPNLLTLKFGSSTPCLENTQILLKFPKLTTLVLPWLDTTGRLHPPPKLEISHLTDLTDLSVPICPPEILVCFKKLKKLHFARANNAHLACLNPETLQSLMLGFDLSYDGAADFQCFAPLTNLKTLSMVCRGLPKNTSILGRLTNLEVLSLPFIPRFPVDIQFTKLKQLVLTSQQGQEEGSSLSRLFETMTNLEKVRILTTSIKPDETIFFSKLTNLNSLGAHESNFSVETMMTLSNLTKLEHIHLKAHEAPSSSTYVNTLRSLTMLKSVQMEGIQNWLSGMGYLEALSLEKLWIPQRVQNEEHVGIARLSHMTNLKTMRYGGVDEFSTKDLEYLRELTNIKRLCLEKVKPITLQLEKLTFMTQLTDLDLQNLLVSDAGIEIITNNFTNLRSLNLHCDDLVDDPRPLLTQLDLLSLYPNK
jgi:hypothetical protein